MKVNPKTGVLVQLLMIAGLCGIALLAYSNSFATGFPADNAALL